MNARHDFNDVIRKPGTRRRIGLIAVLVAVLFAGSQWISSGPGTIAPDGAPVASANAATAPFDYFPSAYVNQAKHAEEHIQAF